MDLWFSETHEGDVRLSWRTKEVLYHRHSRFQDIAVIDTHAFGKMLIIDGCVMTTERDEFVYHELITHPALLAIESPRAVCVVGGGDGGTVREVLKHPSVERVVLAEIDEAVIEVSRRFLPGHTSGLDDPRVEIRIGDGFDYLQKHPGEFDAVLSDSTDPVGPGVVLFEDKYFSLAKSALRPDGCFVTQAGGFWSRSLDISDVRQSLQQHFARIDWYGGPIPTYPGGLWCFLMASDTVDPRRIAEIGRQAAICKTTRYYHPDMTPGLFAVPRFLESGFDKIHAK
jgi:spermidine synthase